MDFTLACRKTMRYRVLAGQGADGPTNCWSIRRSATYKTTLTFLPFQVPKIAVLSRSPRLYSTRRLVSHKQQGHEMVVIDTAYMNIASHKPQITTAARPGGLRRGDPAHRRLGDLYGCAVLRQFEMMGVARSTSPVAISRSRDKLRSLQLLSRKGIGLPVTGFAHSRTTFPT